MTYVSCCPSEEELDSVYDMIINKMDVELTYALKEFKEFESDQDAC